MTMKRHHATSALTFQRGVKLCAWFSMRRVQTWRVLLLLVVGLLSLMLLTVSLVPATRSRKTDVEGFSDLEGSHKILEPLIIHGDTPFKMKEAAPKPKAVLETVKIVRKTVTKVVKHDPILPDDVLSMTPPNLLKNYKNPCWLDFPDTGSRVRCLPYFHLIGVDKSGTTDLWSRLAKHPDIKKPNAVMGKETHWWSWRRFGFDIWVDNARIQHFEEYLRAFDRPAKLIENQTEVHNDKEYHRLITGEGSPTVFWDMTGWNRIPQNKEKSPDTAFLTPHCIHHLTPEAKFIVIFRNPIDRLFSDYLFLQLFRAHKTPLSAQSFHKDVLESIAMLKNCTHTHSLKQCLYNKTLHIGMPVRLPISFYAVYLKEWFKVFPRKNFLIMRNENYAKDIKGHIEQVYTFLGLRKLPDAEMDLIAGQARAFKRNKAHARAGSILPETRTLLETFHKDLNEDLSNLLNDSRFKWTDSES